MHINKNAKKSMEKRYGQGFVVLFVKYVFKKKLSNVDAAHLLTIKKGKHIHHQTIEHWRNRLSRGDDL
jgi:hypothetical protein